LPLADEAANGERDTDHRSEVASFHREELELVTTAPAADATVSLLNGKRWSNTTITRVRGVRQMGLSINETASDFEAAGLTGMCP
jgi:hypothetical protein